MCEDPAYACGCCVVSVHICMWICTWRPVFTCVGECVDVRAHTATHDASVRKGAVLKDVHVSLHATTHIL